MYFVKPSDISDRNTCDQDSSDDCKITKCYIPNEDDISTDSYEEDTESDDVGLVTIISILHAFNAISFLIF